MKQQVNNILGLDIVREIERAQHIVETNFKSKASDLFKMLGVMNDT